MNELYMEDINGMACDILDIVQEVIPIDVMQEDMLFEVIQEYLSMKIGVGDYRNYN